MFTDMSFQVGEKITEDMSQYRVLEVFENAEKEWSVLFGDGETKNQRHKESERKEKGASEQQGTESPASAFWTAACRMIGLKSL